jgi:hypothetical protein
VLSLPINHSRKILRAHGNFIKSDGLKIAVFIFLMTMSLMMFAQTQAQKDSVINEVCKTLNTTPDLKDSLRIVNAFAAHVHKFADRFSESTRPELLEGIFLRAQRLCPQLRILLANVSPPQGDWKRVAEKPVGKATKNDCRAFLKHQQYSYKESDGISSVSIGIQKETWTETFSDGTYSKLKLRWVGDCEFDLEFLESNNAIRQNMSKAGDKYHYRILEKKEGYYSLSYELDGIYSTFRIYIK